MANAIEAVASVSAAHPPARRAHDVDLDRIPACVQGWNTRFTQLGRGPGRGSVVETVLQSARLVRLAVDTPVAMDSSPRASDSEDVFRVATIGWAMGRPLWQGVPVHPDVLLLEESGDASSFALPAGSELLVARLDRNRIESLSTLLRGPECDAARNRSRMHKQPPDVLAALRAHLEVLLQMDATHAARTGVVEADLYERVASMLAAGSTAADFSPESRRRTRRRAEEFMRAHAGQRFSLSDLCRVSQSSERTLRRVFRECYGTTPMLFLKKLRLQGLRRELRDAVPASSTVLEHALNWGFWHMGHLGRDYRLMFGETPSETLAGPGRSLEPASVVTRARSRR